MLNTGDAADNGQDDTSQQPGMWRPLKAAMTTTTTIAICECALTCQKAKRQWTNKKPKNQQKKFRKGSSKRKLVAVSCKMLFLYCNLHLSGFSFVLTFVCVCLAEGVSHGVCAHFSPSAYFPHLPFCTFQFDVLFLAANAAIFRLTAARLKC